MAELFLTLIRNLNRLELGIQVTDIFVIASVPVTVIPLAAEMFDDVTIRFDEEYAFVAVPVPENAHLKLEPVEEFPPLSVNFVV